jgi:serine/threonine-protein kinase
VLEGSVQRAVNRVRVNAQLIDARTDAHLWAQTYDRDLADVFAIQSEIAKTIADQLQAKLSPKEEAAMHEKPTNDMVAYDLYLKAIDIERGRASSIGSGGNEGAKREVDLLEQAVSRDPTFVAALCKLASTHLYLYWLNADHTPARLDMAKKALEAAARLRPDAGEVHLTRAILYYWGSQDYAPALAELALARRSLPNDPGIFGLSGYIERRQGNWEDSTRHLEQALALDPRNIVNISELAAQYAALRRYDDAARTLDSALAWKPFDFALGFLRANVDMAWKADLRQWKDVIAGEAAKTADPNDLITAQLNLALKERDYHGAEQTLAAHGGAEFDDNGFFTPREWNQAIVARGLGDKSRANAALLAARQRAEAAARERPEDGKALIVLGQIDAALGRKEDAIREGDRAVELLPVAKDALIGDALLSRLAGVYAQAGEANRAFDLLEKVTKIPFGVTYGSLKLDEIWDPLRGDPRFEKIVASLAPKEGRR